MDAIQDLLERDAITRRIHAYARALDEKAWDRLDACFHPEARVDYRCAGGPAGAYFDDVRAWLVEVLEPIAVMQHFVTNIEIELDGDHATAIVYGVNVNRMDAEDETTVLTCGGIYRDRLARRDGAWRFLERTEERTFAVGDMPELPDVGGDPSARGAT